MGRSGGACSRHKEENGWNPSPAFRGTPPLLKTALRSSKQKSLPWRRASFSLSPSSSRRSRGQAGGGAAPPQVRGRPVASQAGSKWQRGARHRPTRVLRWSSDKVRGEAAAGTGVPRGQPRGAWQRSAMAPRGKRVFRRRFERGQPWQSTYAPWEYVRRKVELLWTFFVKIKYRCCWKMHVGLDGEGRWLTFSAW